MLDKNTETQPNVLLCEANLRREREKNQVWNGKVRETMMRKFLEGIVEADWAKMRDQHKSGPSNHIYLIFT